MDFKQVQFHCRAFLYIFVGTTFQPMEPKKRTIGFSSRPELLFWVLLVLWLCLDLFQAAFTGIHPDEAYYGLYGQFPAWGYYDHPPMVGLMTFLGTKLLGGKLGIRILTCLLHAATLFLLWKIAEGKKDRKDVFLFFSIAASFIMFSAYGFITTPDAPLLFFTAAFLLSYKKFLEKDNWQSALLTGICMAAIVYSKYHGILIIALVVLSNPKLLGNLKFWSAGLLALLLLCPHILWQVQNDFPSFKYHLVQRNQVFRWKFFLEYVPNQLAVFNPVALPLSLWIAWKTIRSRDAFDRSQGFLTTGFFLFFWLMTFKGHAEPHWTVAASLPMILLIWKQGRKSPVWRKRIFRCTLPFVALLLLARILLLTPLAGTFSFVQKEDYDQGLEQIAQGLPVVFTGSFQNVSVYRFHTGSPSVVLSSVHTRRTQYDLLQLERELQGKPVFVLDGESPLAQFYEADGKTYAGYPARSLQTVNRMEIRADSTFRKNDSLYWDIRLSNPYACVIDFRHEEFPVRMVAGFFLSEGFRTIPLRLSPEIGEIPPGESLHLRVCCTLPETTGRTEKIPTVFCLENKICTSANSPVFQTDLNQGTWN